MDVDGHVQVFSQEGGTPRAQDGSPTEAADERKSSEGFRVRWLAKKPRKNLNSWLSSVCSACEGLAGAQGKLLHFLKLLSRSIPADSICSECTYRLSVCKGLAGAQGKLLHSNSIWYRHGDLGRLKTSAEMMRISHASCGKSIADVTCSSNAPQL